jgi:lysophospholipase L1-like esterase
MATGAKTLVMLCGVNDLAGGSTAVAIMANLEPVFNAAKAQGMTVVPVLPTPWAATVGWTAPKQTETDSLKTLLQTWCTNNGATCVNTDSLGTGSPLVLAAGFDSGDGLHPNAAGAAALAALVQAASP